MDPLLSIPREDITHDVLSLPDIHVIVVCSDCCGMDICRKCLNGKPEYVRDMSRECLDGDVGEWKFGMIRKREHYEVTRKVFS